MLSCMYVCLYIAMQVHNTHWIYVLINVYNEDVDHVMGNYILRVWIACGYYDWMNNESFSFIINENIVSIIAVH